MGKLLFKLRIECSHIAILRWIGIVSNIRLNGFKLHTHIQLRSSAAMLQAKLFFTSNEKIYLLFRIAFVSFLFFLFWMHIDSCIVMTLEESWTMKHPYNALNTNTIYFVVECRFENIFSLNTVNACPRISLTTQNIYQK